MQLPIDDQEQMELDMEDVNFPEDELIEEADGSVVINMDEEQEPRKFGDNLAEYMSEKELDLLALDLF
jgi:hypothetical protein